VHEELFAIRDLWKVDHAMDLNRQRRAQFERALVKGGEKIAEFKASDAALAAEDQVQLAEERRLNRHLQDYTQRRDRTRSMIEEGRAPDFQAAERQLEQCAAIVNETEDSLLGVLDAREQLAARRAAVQIETKLAEKAQVELTARRDREAPVLDAEHSTLLARRPPLLKAVPVFHHQRYSDLRKRNRDVLALVEGGCCSACRIQVSPQVAIEVTTGKRVHNCRGCDRYLYEHADEPE
jgi:predicted  nucleic acid-binding Zn-ribbon protein